MIFSGLNRGAISSLNRLMSRRETMLAVNAVTLSLTSPVLKAAAGISWLRSLKF